MHFFTTFFTALFTLFAFVAAATQPQKSVIVSFPSDTPAHIMESAKGAIIDAGGVITHEYHILKGFAAKGTAKAFEIVSAMGSDQGFTPRIEEDQIVSINGGSAST